MQEPQGVFIAIIQIVCVFFETEASYFARHFTHFRILEMSLSVEEVADSICVSL